METRMHIVVNKSLTKSQRIPQSSHAVAEFMYEHGLVENVKNWVKNHRTMVVLEADDNKMKNIFDSTQSDGYRSELFREPDLDDMVTAIAFEPMTKKEGSKYFARLRLA